MAIAVAGLTLVEGMLFVQSRIGMNDVYVGLFIVAAYTVFAAVWTGWWRGRAAFWLAMPIVGVMLGLALASKWVAAYAIGALVLLLLVRSALGRVVTILVLIGLTGTLGYLAMAGQGFGNIPFLLIMIGLTLLAVVVAVFHPIAWTDEEMWLALAAPTAVGLLTTAVVGAAAAAAAVGAVVGADAAGAATAGAAVVAIAAGAAVGAAVVGRCRLRGT